MSSNTLAEKLHIKPGMKVSFFNAPDNIRQLLGPLPFDIELVDPVEAKDLDFLLAFIENRKMLEQSLMSLVKKVKRNGALWLAYHKSTSSTDTGINRDSISNFAHTKNFKGVAMISLNEDWSGYRLKQL